MLDWLFCCFKNRENGFNVEMGPAPISLSAEPDFRAPIDVGNVYVIDSEPGEEREDKQLHELTMLDVIMNYDSLNDKSRKLNIEGELNNMDWTVFFNEKKSKFSPILYNSELVFDTVSEYDAVFNLDKHKESILSCNDGGLENCDREKRKNEGARR